MPTFHGANNANNIGSTLAAGITSGAVPPFDITVATGDGALFSPIPVPFYLTVALAAETETGVTSVIEIFNVTAVTGDLLTVDARGISNTSAAAWSIGDKAQVRPVDLQFKELGDEINDIESGGILTNVSINAAAAIATTKLADGPDFLQRDGSVVITGDIDFGGFTAENAADPTNPQDLVTLVYMETNAVLANGTVPLTGDLSMDGNKLTDVANATVSGDAVNLDVLQSYSYAQTNKNAVDFTTTADVALTGLGTQAGGDWAGSMTAGQRVLVKDQTSPNENAIYSAAAGAWTLAPDNDNDADWANGMIVYVRSGATESSTLWALTTAPPIVVGVTNLTFARISPPGVIGPNTTMSLGSDATGDVYYRNSSGYIDRLAIGGVGEVLTISGGIPTWASLTGSLSISDPIASSTVGSILFVGSLTDLQQDNANLFWDNTNNRLGLGTASPQKPIHALLRNATTNVVDDIIRLDHESTGTTVASFGAGVVIRLDDSAGTLMEAARVSVKWTEPTAAESSLLFATSAAGTATNKVEIDTDGNLSILTAGTGLRIKEGSNAYMGVATLVGGTVTVNNTRVTSTSRIFLTAQSPGGTPGFLHISARVASTSFTITSSNGADTSEVGWLIIEPAA